MNPRVVYYLPGAGMCGGVKVAFSHVWGLHRRGWDAQVFLVGEGPESWFPHAVPYQSFKNTDELGAALSAFSGVKVATWWETAYAINTCRRPGDNWFYLVQDIETGYCTSQSQANSCLATYKLGLKPLTEGRWVHDQLLTLSSIPPYYVGIGLDRDIFRQIPIRRERNRITCQYRKWGEGNGMKGWNTSLEVIEHARRLNPATEVVTFGMGEAPVLPPGLPHIHLTLPSSMKLRDLFNQTGVFLFTSNHEGFGLPAAEAMACGAAVVSTRAQGNEEFCLDGETCLVGNTVQELAERCVLLQKTPSLADELGARAENFVRKYRWEAVIDMLEAVFSGR